jgi:cell division protein FtsB
MRRETKTWVGRVAAAAMVTFTLGYIPYHVYARSGLARTITLRRDLTVLRAHNRDLRAENERLAREAEALRSDPAAIERVARAELGWVRPGEIIVDFGAPPEPPGRRP